MCKIFNNSAKFIEKSKELYSDKYNYEFVDYVNSKTKVKLICNLHNYSFMQLPSEHLRGKNGCKFCSDRATNTQEFLTKVKKRFGGLYDYSLTNYVNSETKVKIICPVHGIFEKLPSQHMVGQGCPSCSRSKPRSNTETFVAKAIEKHGTYYDYSLVHFIKSTKNVKIVCPKHGIFEQTPSKHLCGQGCKECSIDRKKEKFSLNESEFIERSKKIHADKYDYSLVEYHNSHTKIKIICPTHKIFDQLPYDHLSKHGCPNCSSSVSNIEKEINQFLLSCGVQTITSSLSIIPPYQIDIFIPSHNLAIEFNGLYWHSENKVGKNYHLNKTQICEQNNIRLIHIFEDEWLFKKEIIKSKLKNLLGLTLDRVFARKCVIKDVDPQTSCHFLNTHHLQGKINSKINLGLYYNQELISLMTFTKPRLGIGSHHSGYELSRFCNKTDTIVVGGADKLINHFIKKYHPNQIISYADRRWSRGDLYRKLGFTQTNINKPNYWYIIGKKRVHRMNFRKEKLKKEGFDIKLTEKQIMVSRNIERIYDCGTIVFLKKFEY